MSLLSDMIDDVEDSRVDLASSGSDLKKSAGKIKKSSKSVVKAAKGNIFEFPVFVANSVPLDYATASVSLLEQVYASYLQMAISINPIIDDETARKGAQFDHLKSDTSKYLECVDITDMPYAYDACHAVYNENGIVAEFNLVNIEDSTARIINESLNHEPLSEFDHFFSETYSGDGAAFFEGCEWIQEASYDQTNYRNTEYVVRVNEKDANGNNTTREIHTGLYYHTVTAAELNQTTTTSHGTSRTYDDARTGQGNQTSRTERENDTTTRTFTQHDADVATAANMAEVVDYYHKYFSDEAKNMAEKSKHEADIARENARTFKDDKDLERAAKAAATRLSNANAEKAEKENRDYEEDHDRQKKKDEAEIENKKTSTEKAKAETEKTKRENKWAEEDRELDKAKKLNDARIKTPQFLDESKIQKLNTMKPLMMSVDLNVVDKNGTLSRPVSYVIGVKCHTRLIDSDILPEVAAYPLKEMNTQLRKIKWRSGELKFGRDLLWKTKEKKQTASDSRDRKRKWYRRLYELAHMSGDGTAAASVKNGKSPWANWWQDKLTGGNNKDVGHGLIPNATIILSKSDVDNIKREKDIDLLSGSKAAKFCKELFLIGLVVIDDDAESVKVLLPDLHNDYDVMSMAAIKKQLAQLDTAGNKTRDIMKLLG